MGKGSAPRPFSVANEEYATRWDAIFGRNKVKESCPKCGSEEYDTHQVKPGEGDPSKTYSICCACKYEFNGKPHWE